MDKCIKVGNAQAFWGDSQTAPLKLISQVPDLDYVTMDYLAEVSLSIMAIQREKNPNIGYARDFIDAVRTLIPEWNKGRSFKIITNAGGLNPSGCAHECMEMLNNSLSKPLKIVVVTGDDVMNQIDQSECFRALNTKEKSKKILDKLVSANAYLGAAPIAKALKMGADIVITGRVADPSLTVGPCLYHFGWDDKDWDRLAGATATGHLIECGTQVTGGISNLWMDLPHPVELGFPFAEIYEDGSAVITKPPHTDGIVNALTVKEQLLYEIEDPGNYLSPDCTVSFLSMQVEDQGKNRVRIHGAKGKEPTNTYKVNVTYEDGFKAESMILIFGQDAAKKAKRAGEVLLERLKRQGCAYDDQNIEILGMGDSVPGLLPKECRAIEVVLRIAVKSFDREKVERFTKEIASLVTSGPPGVSGYTSGRSPVRPVYGFWPCLIPKNLVEAQLELFEVNT